MLFKKRTGATVSAAVVFNKMKRRMDKMELSKEQFLQIIDECLKGQKDTIETDDFTFEFGEGKVTVKEKVKENEKPKRWKPEMNEYFYVVGTADGGAVAKWVWLNYDSDNFQYKTGNCFKTKEEAEFEMARRKFMKTFRDIAYEVNEPKTILTYFPVWGGTKVEMLDTYGFMFPGADTVGFTSEEAYHKAMKMVDQGELRKYYFGLPEDYWT